MGGFWNDVTPDSVAAASDGFKEFAIGENEAIIKSVKEDTSQSGNDMLVVTFANDDGAEIKHYIVEGEYKQQKLKQLYTAFKIPIGSKTTQNWLGRRGIVVCKQGKPNANGNVYNQVSYLRPLKSAVNQSYPANAQQNQQTQQNNNANGQTQQNVSGDGFVDDIPF